MKTVGSRYLDNSLVMIIGKIFNVSLHYETNRIVLNGSILLHKFILNNVIYSVDVLVN